MGDTDLTEISDALAGALALVDAAQTDLVVRGWRTDPVRLPLVSLSAPAVRSESGPVLGQYLRSVTYYVQAWRQVRDPESGALVGSAEALLDRVHAVLEETRLLDTASPLYAIPEYAITSSVTASDEQSREALRARGPLGDVIVPAGSVLVIATIELQYRRRTGLSGRDS